MSLAKKKTKTQPCSAWRDVEGDDSSRWVRRFATCVGDWLTTLAAFFVKSTVRLSQQSHGAQTVGQCLSNLLNLRSGWNAQVEATRPASGAGYSFISVASQHEVLDVRFKPCVKFGPAVTELHYPQSYVFKHPCNVRDPRLASWEERIHWADETVAFTSKLRVFCCWRCILEERAPGALWIDVRLTQTSELRPLPWLQTTLGNAGVGHSSPLTAVCFSHTSRTVSSRSGEERNGFIARTILRS